MMITTTHPKRPLLKHMFLAGSLFAVSVAASGSTHAQTPDRLDVQIAINTAASKSIVDYENRRFNVERIKMPRQHELGFVCGSIDPVGSPRFKDDVISYKASLYFRDGSLFASALAPLYMPIDELLLEATCK
ncbi:hypothetical protein J2X72_001071 [Phyllobacterium sp. 1468]|uniref:hypothetical protein n=1 Tax=Phyllobacterium sp. 1468 TaxID=2817759 RepID=UPI0028604DAA|nr:hypothetical protein [Phyllobacterium sp. 1468]MDR6632300.1 hypothetical protein [Phyllobacterium sp. 1468]